MENKAMWVEQLGDAELRDASSPKIFQRGTTYARSGAVRVLSEELHPVPTIQAEVDGTATYSTSVWIDGGVDGACDCPNGSDGWFCKHQVAVALVWRQRLGGGEPVVDEAARKKVQASTKRAKNAKDRRAALHAFLTSLPARVLAEKLMDLADGYREIERELRTWQRISDAQSRPEDNKALITETLTARQFLSWREVGSWVRQAESILPLLQRERARDPQATLALSLHALRRSWAALQRADDSNGDVGGLCRAIAAEWVAALQAAGSQPAAFGETYLRVQLEDPFGSFDTAAAELAMGAPALQRYRHVLEGRWREVKDAVLAKQAQRIPGRRSAVDWSAEDGNGTRLWTVEHLHLEQLERAGDIDGMLAVLREDLSQPHYYATITALLEKHQRLREAFANAEKACKAFPGDRRLEDDLLRCYERDGWTDEAYALRRRQFDAEPSVPRFHLALQAGKVAGKDEAKVHDELLRVIEARESEALRQESALSPFVKRYLRSEPAQRNVSLRAAVLCSERRWLEACALAQPPAVCDPRVLRDIALHLPDAEREQAVALLLRVFGSAMLRAKTPYLDELALVAEIAARLDTDRRAAWLAKLRSEFKAKRNFIGGLPGS